MILEVCNNVEKEIRIIYPGFDQIAVNKTSASRLQRVDGESFVMDWSLPEYTDYKKAFGELSQKFFKLFKDDFIKQENHHSTILSKRLDRIDIDDSVIKNTWTDEDYSKSHSFLSKNLSDFTIKLESCVLAKGGTIQLVFRDEKILPRTRIFLRDLGATIKQGTIDGDFINTCTVVLGYLKCAPNSPVSEEKVRSEILDWLHSHQMSEIGVHVVSLVRYFDLSLNEYVEIAKFYR